MDKNKSSNGFIPTLIGSSCKPTKCMMKTLFRRCKQHKSSLNKKKSERTASNETPSSILESESFGKWKRPCFGEVFAFISKANPSFF